MNLYLPIVINDGPVSIGVQVDGPLIIPVTQHRFYQMPARWMGLDQWLPDIASAVDPNPLIIGTRTCPEQYRLCPDRMGSRPKPEFYDAYVRFVSDLVDRYHPWAIEVWNEPDVPTYTVPADQQYYYGAWVLKEDYHEAGVAYGKLFDMVYRAVSDKCTVLGGALMNGHLVQGREFLRGMLAESRPDYVSMHVYPWFGEAYGLIVSNAIESVQSISGDIPIFITETSLLTKGEDTQEFRTEQAEYFDWARNYMAWSGIPMLWYSQGSSNPHDESWYKCALYRRGEPTPVYNRWAST